METTFVLCLPAGLIPNSDEQNTSDGGSLSNWRQSNHAKTGKAGKTKLSEAGGLTAYKSNNQGECSSIAPTHGL